MPENFDRRTYQRSDNFYCVALVSRDGTGWSEANIFDLSGGGMKLNSTELYDVGEKLWFDLTITGFLTEFEVKVQGTITRRDHTRGHETYGVRFENLSPDLKIRIDESANSFKPKNLLY